MKLLQIALEVAKHFPIEREKAFAKNWLADKIRKGWSDAFKEEVDGDIRENIVARSSAGVGSWNESPFIAFMHKDVSTTPRSGYYPVILFEPGFSTFCLVLAQGADLLKEAHGEKESLKVLSTRALEIRSVAGNWAAAGFSTGPFSTFSRMSKLNKAVDQDPWSASIAFGKRYFADTPPSNEEFAADIVRMLALYRHAISKLGGSFDVEDKAVKDLLDTGELPSKSALISGHDGAMRVARHKYFESRTRNDKLVKAVKKALGYECQGCGVDLSLAYSRTGKKYIEAHHLVPLSSMPKEGVELSQTDFAVLCPNCHKVIHQLGCPGLDGLRQAIHNDVKKFNRDLKKLHTKS